MTLLESKIKEYFTKMYQKILGTVIVMELDLVQKSILVILLIVANSIFFGLYLVMVWLHPNWYSYINIEMFRLLGKQIATIILLAAILMWAGFLLKDNLRTHQYMPWISNIFFALSLCTLGYMLGAMSPATGIFMVGTPIIGLVLFSRLMVLPLTIISIASMMVLGYAGMMGFIPYAPIFADARGASLNAYSVFTFYTQLYFSVPPSLLIIILSDVLLKQWHERGREVTLLSQLDSLTNLYNRRTVNEHLERLLEMSTEADQISILLLDLDYFKKINDVYGHMVGDSVLREVGHLLQSTMRKNDLAGRFGGEEFIVVLYRSAYEIGMSVAERIRKRISEISVQTTSGQSVQVTSSVGVSTFAPFGMNTIDQILSQADQALYKAKDLGRNQVVHYNHLLHDRDAQSLSLPVNTQQEENSDDVSATSGQQFPSTH